MDKIYAKGISLSAEPKPVRLWSCARAKPARIEKIPGVFPVAVVQFIALLSHVQLFGSPMDCCSPSGSSVHGILQARILQWVAISFSMESPQSRDRTLVSCIDRQILYHWATREAPYFLLFMHKMYQGLSRTKVSIHVCVFVG